MEIRVDLKLFIFVLIFIITRQIKIFTFMMFFALMHECGHLLAGILLGLKPQSIEVAAYGFRVNFKTECIDYNDKIKNASILSLKKIIIASAGPLVNLLVIFFTYIYYIITKSSLIFNIRLDLIVYSNLLIFIFNLIPIYPLDGGRIAREIIHINYGIQKAYMYSNKISNISVIVLTVLASFLILIYRNIAILIAIWYLWYLVMKQNRYYEKFFKAIYCKNV